MCVITTSGGGYAPLTIEELVSSPRILPHQHQNKVPPQASFPLKASSSLTASNELKVIHHCCSHHIMIIIMFG